MRPNISLRAGPQIEVLLDDERAIDIGHCPHVALPYPLVVVGSATLQDLAKIIAGSPVISQMFQLKYGEELGKLLEPALNAKVASQTNFQSLRLQKTIPVASKPKQLTAGMDDMEFVALGIDGKEFGLALTAPEDVALLPVTWLGTLRLIEDDPYSHEDGQLKASYRTGELTLMDLLSATVQTLALMQQRTEEGVLLRHEVSTMMQSVHAGATKLIDVPLQSAAGLPVQITAGIEPGTLSKWRLPNGSFKHFAEELAQVFTQHDCEGEVAYRVFCDCPDDAVFVDYATQALGAGAFKLTSTVSRCTGYDIRKQTYQAIQHIDTECCK